MFQSRAKSLLLLRAFSVFVQIITANKFYCDFFQVLPLLQVRDYCIFFIPLLYVYMFIYLVLYVCL